jgi:hypothetical protein
LLIFNVYQSDFERQMWLSSLIELPLGVAVASTMCQTGKDYPVNGHYLMRCRDSWNLTVRHPGDDRLTVFLRRRRFFSPNETLASSIIPIGWFPVDRVVRDWFPLTPSRHPAWLLLDSHLDSRHVRPFGASFTRMLWLATWERPNDEFAECPALPHTVVVVDDQMSALGQLPHQQVMPQNGSWTGSCTPPICSLPPNEGPRQSEYQQDAPFFSLPPRGDFASDIPPLESSEHQE